MADAGSGRRPTPGEPDAPAPSRAPQAVDKFAEYQLFIESTEKLTDRRQRATQVWVTLHTLLFTALGFLMKNMNTELSGGTFAGPRPALFVGLTIAPLLLVGIFSCVIWRKMLLNYRSLIGWRYEQLMEMERSDAMSGLHRVFVREWEDFFGPEARRTPIGFTKLEAMLPVVLLFVYAAFAVVAAMFALGVLP